MSSSRQRAVRIAVPTAAGPLSRIRKQFNTLVKKLEAERVRLALWREEAPKIRTLAASELRPLVDAFHVHYRQLLVLLDQAWSNKVLSKKDREKLSDFICKTAMDLMQADEDDASVKEIYDRHSEFAFDPDLEEDKAFMLDMVHAATGLDLGDDVDLSSPHALFEAMRNKMEEQEQEAERREQARPARLGKRAARQQAEEAKLKQSVRDIFRKLASILHPDRETDPAERTRKTALMQRANAAYAANDLLGLLELQLEVEQIDQAGIDILGDDRIKQYNRILEGQVAEIQGDIMALETILALDIGRPIDGHLLPKDMLKELRSEIGAMREDIEQIAEDLAQFADIKKLKAFLKTYRIEDDGPENGAPWF